MRALPCLVLLLAACTTWQPVTTPTPLDSTTRLKGNVRVTIMGGQTKIGNDPFVRGEQLILPRADGSVDSVHRGRVVLVEQSVPDGRKSFLTLAVVVALVVFLAAGWSQGGPPIVPG